MALIKDYYEYSKIIENGQIVVVNNPLMLYSPANSNDCSLELNSCKDTNFTENLYFQEYSKTVFDLTKKNDFTANIEAKESLAVLEVYASEPDRPEFVDITKLSDLTEKPTSSNDCDVFELSDDDEVIFVKEYKESGKKQRESTAESIKVDNSIRRNPVRNVRNKSKDLSKELIFEEDFAFLDASDDEVEEKENKVIEKKSEPVKLPKEWPINVHERPEYNASTDTIESFDYTIRKIQENATTFKKPKTDLRKIPKKKPAVKKKRTRAPRDSKKVSIEELKPLVNTATDMLKDFFINSKKHKDLISSKSQICSFENKLEILKNQAFLFAIVNNLDQNEVIEKFKLLNVDNESKS